MLDIAVREGARRILMDGRAITGNPRALERYLYGKFAAEASNRMGNRIGEPLKFAYVLTPPVLHPARLGELTARRRGMLVRVFEEMDDAREWLLSRRNEWWREGVME